MGFLDAMFRMTQQWQFHRRWFGKDKPDRLRLGYTPDGLYPHERSAADKERASLSTPHEPNQCS